MSEDDVQTMVVSIEFYTLQETPLSDICTITLYKKVGVESFYERKEIVEKFKDNEDLFLSWLSSIASSRGYAIARAITKDNGTALEALVLISKPKYFINFPYITRIRKIYIVKNLGFLEQGLDYSQVQELSTEISNTQGKSEDKGNALLTPLLDLSNEELYLFFSPITLINRERAEALILETDRGIIFLRFDSTPQLSSSVTRANTSTKKKRRGRRRKSKTRKKSRFRSS